MFALRRAAAASEAASRSWTTTICTWRQRLVAGVDLWVNLPRPPLEASGTSGMKVVLNGGLNLSVLDGWWVEGYDGETGWAIATPDGDAARAGRP